MVLKLRVVAARLMFYFLQFTSNAMLGRWLMLAVIQISGKAKFIVS